MARNMYGANATSSKTKLNTFKGKDVEGKVHATLDRLLVEFGREILKIVPGKVSTEVDARFSFDTKASVDKALHLIDVGCCSCPSWHQS